MSQKILLKVLNGLQSGAEVALEEGTYSIGNSPEDDIQLKDASLQPRQAMVRIDAGGAEISAQSGDVLFASGATLSPGDGQWTRIEPLSVLVLGTTRLSFGPVGAKWSTVIEDREFRREAQPGRVEPPEPEAAVVEAQPASVLARLLELKALQPWRDKLEPLVETWDARPNLRLAVGVSSALGLLGLALALPGGGGNRLISTQRDFIADRLRVEQAVTSLPFAKKVRVQQEADGQIYVKGIMKDAAERRAVVNAVEATRVPYKPRLATGESILLDVRNLATAQQVKVKASLREDGVLALSGVILDPKQASQFITIVRAQVLGPTDIDVSKIKDGNDLTAEISRLASDDGVGANVAFALVGGSYIEATGTVPSTQTDAWIGFLINYGDLYADKVPLRSLVQVIGVPGSATANAPMSNQPLVIGSGDADGRVLDLQKLRNGKVALGDVFVGQRATGWADTPAPSKAAATGDAPKSPRDFDALRKQDDPAKLIEKWASGNLAGTNGEKALATTLDQLAEIAPGSAGAGDKLAARQNSYLSRILRQTLVAGGAPSEDLFADCEAKAPNDASGLLRALFWLDMLSMTDGLSLTAFDKPTQLQLAEVMLNPDLVSACLSRLKKPEVASYGSRSPFLNEMAVNKAYLRFLIRDVASSALTLSGATTGRNGYVVDDAGRIYRTGNSIDLYSKVRSIGELGVVIETANGAEILPFDGRLAWVIRNRPLRNEAAN